MLVHADRRAPVGHALSHTRHRPRLAQALLTKAIAVARQRGASGNVAVLGPAGVEAEASCRCRRWAYHPTRPLPQPVQ